MVEWVDPVRRRRLRVCWRRGDRLPASRSPRIASGRRARRGRGCALGDRRRRSSEVVDDEWLIRLDHGRAERPVAVDLGGCAPAGRARASDARHVAGFGRRVPCPGRGRRRVRGVGIRRGHGGILCDDVVAGAFTDVFVAQSPPVRKCSGCRRRTTAVGTAHCCPNGPGRSVAADPISTGSGGRPRALIAVGQESLGTVTGRTAAATAELIGSDPVVLPSRHLGFASSESGCPGQPQQFADRLRCSL